MRTTMHFVVVRPHVSLSTVDVYRNCEPAETAASVDGLCEALAGGDVARVGRCLTNRLTAAAEKLTPIIGELRRVFSRLDVLGHGMSGSGSSYFGICRHARQARRIAAWLTMQGMGRVRAVRSTL